MEKERPPIEETMSISASLINRYPNSNADLQRLNRYIQAICGYALNLESCLKEADAKVEKAGQG